MTNTYVIEEKEPIWIARWFSLMYCILICIASLYPYSPMVYFGQPIFGYLQTLGTKLHYYDIILNIFGYMPFGYCAQLAMHPRKETQYQQILPSLLGITLAITMETLQSYLPSRYPSSLDVLSNFMGTLLGSLLACCTIKNILMLRHRINKRGWLKQNGIITSSFISSWALLFLLASLTPMMPLFGINAYYLSDLVPSVSILTIKALGSIEELIIFSTVIGVGLFIGQLMTQTAPRWTIVLGFFLTTITLHAISIYFLFDLHSALTWLRPNLIKVLIASMLVLFCLMPLGETAHLVIAMLSLVVSVLAGSLQSSNPYYSETLKLFWLQNKWLHIQVTLDILAAIWITGTVIILLSLILAKLISSQANADTIKQSYPILYKHNPKNGHQHV